VSVVSDQRLFADFCQFGKAHVATRDVDPMYYVLPRYYRLCGFGRETAAWYTFLFVAWYHLGSVERVFRLHPRPGPIFNVPAGTVFGLDRRCFRGVGNRAVLDHVNAAVAAFGRRPYSWSASVAGAGGEAGWQALFQAFKALPWGGHWSAYKWCKLMKNAFGLPIESPRVGQASGGERAGPIPGLVKLTGLPWKRCATDVGLHRALLAEMNARGVPYKGLDNLDCGLCNFNGVTIGRYYLGKNIDAQQGALKGANPVLWAARDVIPSDRRGELNGWAGLRKPLLRAYVDQQILIL